VQRQGLSHLVLGGGQEEKSCRGPAELAPAEQLRQPSEERRKEARAPYKQGPRSADKARQHIVCSSKLLRHHTPCMAVRMYHLQIGAQHEGGEACGPPCRAVARGQLSTPEAGLEWQDATSVLHADPVEHAPDRPVELRVICRRHPLCRE